MSIKVHTLHTPLPFRMGKVSCYLIESAGGFLLIDTGAPSGRKCLDMELERFGCHPGKLQLIILTHGDFDHTGSAAYLREKYGAKIAMHPDDSGMAEQADMFWNRGGGNIILKKLVPRLFGFNRKARFTPDILLEDGLALADYGLDAAIISLPGHSKGSIGVLLSTGILFCGDLLMNDKAQPSLGFGDSAEFIQTIHKIREIQIRTIYPGHGNAFDINPAIWERLISARQEAR
jgi:hydroxyacylglutathione hydrolase